jgi:hypothetical protein
MQVGWAGLGWAGLGWAGLGWAGLGCMWRGQLWWYAGVVSCTGGGGERWQERDRNACTRVGQPGRGVHHAAPACNGIAGAGHGSSLFCRQPTGLGSLAWPREPARMAVLLLGPGLSSSTMHRRAAVPQVEITALNRKVGEGCLQARSLLAPSQKLPVHPCGRLPTYSPGGTVTKTLMLPPTLCLLCQVEALSADNASLRSINGVLDKVVNLRDEHIGGLQQALQVRGGVRFPKLLAGVGRRAHRRAAAGGSGIPRRICQKVKAPGPDWPGCRGAGAEHWQRQAGLQRGRGGIRQRAAAGAARAARCAGLPGAVLLRLKACMVAA